MCIRQWARDEEMVVHVPASAKRAITHDVVLRGLAVERDRLLNRSHLLLGCQCLVDAEDVYPEEIQLCPVGPVELLEDVAPGHTVPRVYHVYVSTP